VDLEEARGGVGRETEHSMYKVSSDSKNALHIFTASPRPQHAFPENYFPLSPHSCDKGSSVKSDAFLVKAAHAEAGYKSPASNYFAVFRVTTSCGLVRGLSTSVHKPAA
jgi:hypothetical protein